MRKKGVFVRIIPAIIFLAISALAFAKAPPQVQKRKLYFIHLKAKNVEVRSKIANFIHIDQLVEDSIYSVINQVELKNIKREIPHLIEEFHLLEEQSFEHYLDIPKYQFPKGDESFHTYNEVVSELKALATKYPNIVQYFSIGKSLEGLDIPGIKITNKLDKKRGDMVPAILFTGSHHAREHLSTEVPMLLLRHLIESYGSDKTITSLVDNRVIYFVPLVNPDGAMWDIYDGKYKTWRKNRRSTGAWTHGVDLNRNYSYKWGTGGSSKDHGSEVYMGPKPFSEPETKAMKKFVESISNLRILLSFHTFSELILYPWGHSKYPVSGKDGEVFKKMATTMSKWNKYTPKQASGLYVASGDTCDWAYGERGIFCFTFELSPKWAWGSAGFYPGAKAIVPTFKANIRPALYLIEHAADPHGVLDTKLL